MRASRAGEPDAAAVSVRDQGEGISPEVAPGFPPVLARASRGGQHGGGTGLGLYIVKGLVEAHGGTIGVQCAPGGGADSDLSCPRGQSRADGAPGGHASRPGTVMSLRAIHTAMAGLTPLAGRTPRRQPQS